MLLTDARTIETKRKIQQAVEAGLKARKISARRASIDVVGNDGLVRDIRAGVMPAVDRLEALMDYLGLSFNFGPPREANPAIQSNPVTQVILEGTEYASIALHEASLSAGPGFNNGSSNIIDHLAFRRDWLHRLNVNPSQACLARIAGDSMFPTLSANDMVLLDTRQGMPQMRDRSNKDKRRSPIYAFVQDGEARVKRLERPATDVVMLISDNPDYAPELLTGQQATSLEVIGKVVWWGHTNRD